MLWDCRLTVNRYISSEQAERESPYGNGSQQSDTRAEADARNTIGRRNREQAGLGSSYGESEKYYEQQEQERQFAQEQQQQIEQRQQQQVQQDRISDSSYAARAFAQSQSRPGYTRESDIGDSETARRVAAGEDMGAVLESQRQAALLTPGTRDDQYYSGELSKWAQNKVETSSAFHHLTKDEGATDVKENPYELQGDLAVEMLKGSPNKRSEFFSPVSGRMNPYLPNDKGLQENSWDTARTGKPQPGSYRDAIDVINRSKGGLVTGTMGTPDRTSLNSPVDSIGGRNLPAPFKSTLPNNPQQSKNQNMLDKLNYEIGGALGIRANAWEQETLPPAQKQDPQNYLDMVREGFKNTPILSKFYDLGASMDKGTVESVKGFVTSAPVLENIAKGGRAFAAQRDIEFAKTPEQYNKAVENYQSAARDLVGPESNDQQMTSGIGQFFIGGGEVYRKSVTEPFTNLLSPLERNQATSVLKSAAVGFVSTPGAVSEVAGMSIIGGERLIKNVGNTPGLAASGFAMQAEGFVKDPAGSAATLAGSYLLFSGAGALTTKGIGYARTVRKTYVPIEDIGYTPEAGYPLAPKGLKATELKTSFERNTLTPVPSRMNTGEAVPYVPENTALTGEVAGKTYMWTGWENTPYKQVGVAGRVAGKTKFTLQKGASEIPGMYGAPVAESYFSKVGGQAPETLGFSFIRTPSLMRTELGGLDMVPGGLSRRTVAMKASGVDTAAAYADMNVYIQENVKPGRAVLPMTKLEYEAVLQSGNVLEITKSQYYTKVGGIGKDRLFGTRLPIFETKATGEFIKPEPSVLSKTVGGSDYSYKPEARVGAYSLAGAVGVSNKGYAESSRTGFSKSQSVPQEPDAYRGQSSSTRSSSRLTSSPFSGTSSPISTSYGKSSKGPSTPPYRPEYSSPNKPISTPPYSPKRTSIFTPETSPPYTPGKTPTYTPKRTPPRSPPYSPPYTPTTAPPETPPFMGLLPGAAGSSGDRPFLNRGQYNWGRTNPVADIPYLSRDPFTAKGKRKKSLKSLFG